MVKFKNIICVLVFLCFCAQVTVVMAKEENKSVPFLLLSPAFEAGQEILDKFSCHGADINPPLEIYNPPVKTQTLVITLQDLDAPEGIWTHWVVYNIPPQKLSIGENSVPGAQLLNDFGKYTYAGPCPVNDKPHRFVFTAYALNAVLENNEGWTIVDLHRAMRSHIIAKTELKVNYRKVGW